MKLVRQIQINKKHKYWKSCDNLCFISKNLYNKALWFINQEFENNGKYLNYNSINSLMVELNDENYRALPAKVSQQILILLDQNYRSFFSALKEYKKKPDKFKSCPKIPKYKHKSDGRFICIFSKQSISIKSLKKGILKLLNMEFPIRLPIESIKQVRIIPNSLDNYTIEIIYEKQEEILINSFNYAGIDLGLNNLAVVVFNNENIIPIIINGRPLKSINQYYNKKLAKLKSELSSVQFTSNKIKKLFHKRNNKIKDYLHKSSRRVVDYLKQNNISKVVIGQNLDWKTSINIGSKNNQNFVSIPHSRFIKMLEYKCQLLGIKILTTEESYTSKCSFFDEEEVRKHNNYKGIRVKRGLFKTSNNLLINADQNGALNILKKHLGEVFPNRVEGLIVSPKLLKV